MTLGSVAHAFYHSALMYGYDKLHSWEFRALEVEHGRKMLLLPGTFSASSFPTMMTAL